MTISYVINLGFEEECHLGSHTNLGQTDHGFIAESMEEKPVGEDNPDNAEESNEDSKILQKERDGESTACPTTNS